MDARRSKETTDSEYDPDDARLKDAVEEEPKYDWEMFRKHLKYADARSVEVTTIITKRATFVDGTKTVAQVVVDSPFKLVDDGEGGLKREDYSGHIYAANDPYEVGHYYVMRANYPKREAFLDALVEKARYVFARQLCLSNKRKAMVRLAQKIENVVKAKDGVKIDGLHLLREVFEDVVEYKGEWDYVI